MIIDKFLNTPICELYRYNRQEGTFGVEIEVEGRNLPEAIYGWQVHREGSLRGEANEYVTAGAVTEEKLFLLMKVLEKDLTAEGVITDVQSYRASTHIHVNVQALTLKQILHSVGVFAIIEPLFMRLCGPTRDGNLFCLPSYDCGDMHKFVSDFLTVARSYRDIDLLPERGKYSALNLNCIKTLGTLEFRTFPCSISTTQVLDWAGWCKNIINHGMGVEDLLDEINSALDEPVDFALKFFSQDILNDLPAVELISAIEIGCEGAYEIYHAMLKQNAKNLKEAA